MKKRNQLVGIVVLSSLIAGGCAPIDNGIEKADAFVQEKLASISVPFEWFKKDEVVDKEVVIWRDIQSLKLPEKDTAQNDLKKQLNAIQTLQEEVKTNWKLENFLGSDRNSYRSFGGFGTAEDKDDVFGETLRELYSKPYRDVHSLTLVGAGEATGIEKTDVLLFTMNVINDESDFVVYPFKALLNEEGLITAIHRAGNSALMESLPSPLSEKSEWNEKVHQEFEYQWKDLTAYPVTDGWKDVTEADMVSWLATNGAAQAENGAKHLLKWLQSNEGDLSLARITGYLHTDERASALTLYEISYPMKEQDEPVILTVSYDRGLNKITDIQTGSPFEGLPKGE